MTPWPFSYFPWPLNFLAIWTGYTILLITVYCALMALLRWWVEYRYHDEIREWAEMQEKAERIRRKIHEN